MVNGLTLPYSSGAVEGIVSKVKVLKRQMHGRANLDLLRSPAHRTNRVSEACRRCECRGQQRSAAEERPGQLTLQCA